MKSDVGWERATSNQQRGYTPTGNTIPRTQKKKKVKKKGVFDLGDERETEMDMVEPQDAKWSNPWSKLAAYVNEVAATVWMPDFILYPFFCFKNI